MAFSCVGSRRVRSRALVAMIGIVAIAVAAVASPAEAARKKKRPAGGGYAPPYAAMVVDARSPLPGEGRIKGRIHLDRHALHQRARAHIVETVWLVRR